MKHELMMRLALLGMIVCLWLIYLLQKGGM
jgi:hypothetical protein